jgi:phage protein U
MYAQLGDIVFDGLKGFTDFSLKKSASIAVHNRIDGKPKLQNTGNNLDQLSLTMMFHSSFCVPEVEIAKLDTARNNGTILSLITGYGESLGSFVVSETAQSIQHMFPNGKIRMATLQVTLIESASVDTLADAQLQAKRGSFSNSNNSPATVPYVELTGAGLKATRSLVEATSLQAVGTQQLTLAQSSPSVRANEMAKAKKTFTKINDSIQEFENQFSSIQSVVSNADQILIQSQLAATYAQTVIAKISDGDVAGAVSANRDLRNGLLDVNSSSITIVKLTATRRI